jgi:hypothetical protein
MRRPRTLPGRKAYDPGVCLPLHNVICAGSINHILADLKFLTKLRAATAVMVSIASRENGGLSAPLKFETEKGPNPYGRKTVDTTFGIYSERPIRQFLESPSCCRFTQRCELSSQILGQHICDDLIDGLAAATWGPQPVGSCGITPALCHQCSASGGRRSTTHPVIAKAIPNKNARKVRLGITSILPLPRRPHAISTSSFSSGNLPAHGMYPRVNPSCSSTVSATTVRDPWMSPVRGRRQGPASGHGRHAEVIERGRIHSVLPWKEVAPCKAID